MFGHFGLPAARILLLLAAVFGVSSAASAPLVDQPYRIGYGDRFTTKAQINGEGPFDLLLDTASSKTFIYAHIGRRLRLEPSEGAPITVHGIAGTTTSLPYMLRELRLSDERISNLAVAILPDPTGNEAEPDGVLGVDVLERYFLALDRAAGRLNLYPRGATPEPYTTWPYVRLAPRRLAGLNVDFWFIDAVFGGRPARTLFDLGTGVTILNWPLARQLIRRKDMPAKSADGVRDALGKGLPGFRIQKLNVEIARRTWRDQIALVVDAPVLVQLELSRRPSAIVGANLLRDDSIAIDFEHQRLYIAPRD
jgi:hypothetical protein